MGERLRRQRKLAVADLREAIRALLGLEGSSPALVSELLQGGEPREQRRPRRKRRPGRSRAHLQLVK